MEKLLIGAVVFLASISQGMFGFAFMLIALPLLSFFSLSPKVTVPLLSLFLALLSGILTVRLRARFDYKNTMPLLVGAVMGIPVGVFFLLASSDKIIKATLGIVLIVYSSYSLFFKRPPFRLPGWTGYLFGFFAGALGGAYNMTGPPVIFFISTQEWPKSTIVGSLNFFFTVTTMLVLVFHLLAGNISWAITVTFLELAPVAVIGMLLGMWIFRKMDEENYRNGIFVLLTIMGIMLMV